MKEAVNEEGSIKWIAIVGNCEGIWETVWNTPQLFYVGGEEAGLSTHHIISVVG